MKNFFLVFAAFLAWVGMAALVVGFIATVVKVLPGNMYTVFKYITIPLIVFLVGYISLLILLKKE